MLAAGVGESATTVHLVDAAYDQGEVLGSIPVPVQLDSDVESLQGRVQSAERDLLIATINRLALSD